MPTLDPAGECLRVPTTTLPYSIQTCRLSPSLPPSLLQVSFIRWASEGLAVNEFTGLKFTCSGPMRGPCTETGEQALERVSFEKSSVKKAALMQSRLIGGFYGMTLLTLQRNKPKFMSITPPVPQK